MLWHNCSRTADWSARLCLAGQLIVAHNLNSRYITAVVLRSLPATMCSPLLLGCHYSLLHVFTRLVWLLHELARAGFKISSSDFLLGHVLCAYSQVEGRWFDVSSVLQQLRVYWPSNKVTFIWVGGLFRCWVLRYYSKGPKSLLERTFHLILYGLKRKSPTKYVWMYIL